MTTFTDTLDVLSSAPPLPNRKQTFFDISGTEDREVVISQWYKYYLNPNENHGLGNLFLQTLLQLSGAPFTIEHCMVETEVQTKKGNYIDILVTGIGVDRDKYIIIENKVYHHLHNDLDDYWHHCDTGSKKLGILLTLKREPEVSCRMFKNILHLNWVRVVAEQLKGYELTSEQQYYFDNFKNAIYNLNRYTIMSEHVSYYFMNTEAVNRAIACKDEAERYIVHQVASAGHLLGMQLDRTDSPRLRDLLIHSFEKEVFYSVIFDGLFTPANELRIVLALRPQHLNRVQELDGEFKTEAESRGLKVNDNPGRTWHNYLTQRYQLTHDQWASLDDFIKLCIEQDFQPLAQPIGQYLKQNKSDVVSSKPKL